MSPSEFKDKYKQRRRRGPKRGMVGTLAALSGYSPSHICNVAKLRTRSATVEAMIADWKAGKIKEEEVSA